MGFVVKEHGRVIMIYMEGVQNKISRLVSRNFSSFLVEPWNMYQSALLPCPAQPINITNTRHAVHLHPPIPLHLHRRNRILLPPRNHHNQIPPLKRPSPSPSDRNQPLTKPQRPRNHPETDQTKHLAAQS